MNNKQDAAVVINLLAGAAQAGAKGVLAQAAFNLMKASEAVIKAKQLNVDEKMLLAAVKVLQNAQDTLNQALQLPDAMEEAKQDIINANSQPYSNE